MTSGCRLARDRVCSRWAEPRSSRSPAPSAESSAARLSCNSQWRSSAFGDQVGALVADDEFVALIARFGAPGDNSEIATARRFARGDDGAARVQGIAGIYRAVKFQIVDSEKWAARFAQVLDGNADYGARDQHGINDDVRMPVRARVLGVEVERAMREGRRREQ